MNKEENLKKLKMALTERKPLHVYIKVDSEWFDMGIFNFSSEQKIYVGEWGFMPLEGAFNSLNNKDSHIRLEVYDDRT